MEMKKVNKKRMTAGGKTEIDLWFREERPERGSAKP